MKGLETVTAFVSPAGRSLSELDPLPQSPTEDLASSQPGAGKEPWRPSTPTPAEYWIAFYDELVTYQSEMLAKMADLTKNVSDPEARALEINDLGPLRDLIADGRRRAEVWRQVADSGEFFGSTEMGITAK